MPLPIDFPKSPHEILVPNCRWTPDNDEFLAKLPPLVAQIRAQVYRWREKHYAGASHTSMALLNWWFNTPHPQEGADGVSYDFQYYFAQRESVESIIWLYEVAKVKDKHDLMRYDNSGDLSANHFKEDWLRLVIKMATGSGKTKVMSLLIAWSYFHKRYELGSELSRNFLLIAPNIIVLDRIKTDFVGLNIFYEDPILPEDGFEGQNWREDFQLNIHFQDDIRKISSSGNIFLTNIHRVYQGNEVDPSADDDDTTSYYLGDKAAAKTSDSGMNLDELVRDIDELMVINDEAHHIHNDKLSWFSSIADISNNLKMKGAKLALHIDVTATPKHEDGSIFVQTIADYPLVEAIEQGVVKTPVLPNRASRNQLEEKASSKFTEQYADYINLGVEEWRKVAPEHEKLNKKAVLFIMTDDTKNCDEVAEYLESTYPELAGAVLTIHTKKNGEISEATTGKKEQELQELRKQANDIDSLESPYKVIISVLMLKEGWDTRNVTTIVGLRAYSSKSKILPEQTLGRGLRLMYPNQGIQEKVSLIGTEAFMEFVEGIEVEGVSLVRDDMGGDSKPKAPIVVEVDRENMAKDMEGLDIKLPILIARIMRDERDLGKIDVSALNCEPLEIETYNLNEAKNITFTSIHSHKTSHETELKQPILSSQNAISWFVKQIKQGLRLTSHNAEAILYGKVKLFIQDKLFVQSVDILDKNTLRNLNRSEVQRTIIESFKSTINSLTITDEGGAQIEKWIQLTKTRPFVAKSQSFIKPQKSVFNKIIGDSHFELEFARFLEESEEVMSYAKNYLAIHFKIDYQNADGELKYYYPDFFVKTDAKTIYIIELKGLEDLDAIEKNKRLNSWCADVNKLQNENLFVPMYIKQTDWQNYPPQSFNDLLAFAPLRLGERF